mgnify:CR=1 FL=1
MTDTTQPNPITPEWQAIESDYAGFSRFLREFEAYQTLFATLAEPDEPVALDV